MWSVHLVSDGVPAEQYHGPSEAEARAEAHDTLAAMLPGDVMTIMLGNLIIGSVHRLAGHANYERE